MMKTLLYKKMFLKGDVQNILDHIEDKEEIKGILGNIHPVYYPLLYKKLKRSLTEEKVRTLTEFRHNPTLYHQLFLEEDVKKIIESYENKEKVKTFVKGIDECHYKHVYRMLLERLSDEKAREIAGYSDYVEAKSDLFFLWKENEEKSKEEKKESNHEHVELKKEMKTLREELEELKNRKTPEELTEEMGEKIFQ